MSKIKAEIKGWRMWVYLVLGAVLSVLVQSGVLTEQQGELGSEVVDTAFGVGDEEEDMGEDSDDAASDDTPNVLPSAPEESSPVILEGE